MGTVLSRLTFCNEEPVVSYEQSPQSPHPSRCMICSQPTATSPPIIVCPFCKKSLGHISCISYWIMNHKHCPYCTFTLV